MLRRSLLAATGLCLLASQAQAELFKRAHRDCQRNKCWPAPFLVPDRIAGRAPFAVMINNGWRLQNTLSDDHFDSNTGMLNEAGELKVRDILTYSPPEHRTVFVLQARDEEATTARNRSVSEFVSHIPVVSSVPLVAQTSIRPRTAPAEYVNTIGTKFQETIPDPRLPAMTSGMGGGSGGGGGGGGF